MTPWPARIRDNFVPFLRRQLQLGLDREDAIEL
jgi:hypothetical protein